MRTVKEKLASLNENDVWVFTKHIADFDQAVKMTRLFSEIPDRKNANIESYFADHHERYGVTTNRHRALVIPQMFGLITRTPFYIRRSRYQLERPTPVFEALKHLESGSPAYNTIKTEQLLKVKMRPIIDTTNGNYDHEILPVIFSFRVLWRLKELRIDSITTDQFYTYVMTCKTSGELDEAVALLATNPTASPLLPRFKSKSRIKPLFSRSCKLFTIRKDRISINDTFGEYFQKSFILPTDLSRFDALLDRPEEYADFLYDIQGFGINLIDPPAEKTRRSPFVFEPDADTRGSERDEEKYDSDYVASVDSLLEESIDLHAGDNAYKKPPQTTPSSDGKRIKKNPALGKIAIVNSGYKCIANKTHSTFQSRKTRKDFMEAHHLIPLSYALPIWKHFNANIDCVENIVSLCPNCHRAVHYGTGTVKSLILRKLFNLKREELERIGIQIAFDDLLRMYSTKKVN